MKPKEKAKELIKRFDYPNIPTGLMSIERKQCALICVDEIIKSNELRRYPELKPHLNSIEYTSDDGWVNDEKSKYWQEVKSIIQEL